jgi:ParB-like chromosome segregation protein Spo0J
MIKRECSYDEDVKIEELKAHPKNPNQHPDKQVRLLADLIRAHGWRAPVTVSKRSGYIIRGHGRFYAAIELDEDQVPVDYQDYGSDEQEMADLVADNHIAELAQRDDELLLEILESVNDSDLDLELTGFDSGDLDKIAASMVRKKEEKPEVEFSEELHESSNYVVLYFDNDIDWLQALTLFDLKTVKALDSKPGFTKQGIGRVLNGSVALNKLMEGK